MIPAGRPLGPVHSDAPPVSWSNGDPDDAERRLERVKAVTDPSTRASSNPGWHRAGKRADHDQRNSFPVLTSTPVWSVSQAAPAGPTIGNNNNACPAHMCSSPPFLSSRQRLCDVIAVLLRASSLSASRYSPIIPLHSFSGHSFSTPKTHKIHIPGSVLKSWHHEGISRCRRCGSVGRCQRRECKPATRRSPQAEPR